MDSEQPVVMPANFRSLIHIASTFLGVGAVAFGGLGATVALLERELAERQAVMSKAQITEALTYTKLLPGSTVVQVVAYLGWQLRGWRGTVVATAAFLLPSVIAMLALASAYTYFAHIPVVAAVRRGVLAAVVALLVLTLYRLGRPILTRPLPMTLAVGAFAAVFARVEVVLVVLVAGIVGMIRERRRG